MTAAGDNQPLTTSCVEGVNVVPHREMPVKIELPVFKPKNECNVIKII